MKVLQTPNFDKTTQETALKKVKILRVSIINLQHCSKMSSQPPIKLAILSTMKTQECVNSGEVRYGTNELRLLS